MLPTFLSDNADRQFSILMPAYERFAPFDWFLVLINACPNSDGKGRGDIHILWYSPNKAIMGGTCFNRIEDIPTARNFVSRDVPNTSNIAFSLTKSFFLNSSSVCGLFYFPLVMLLHSRQGELTFFLEIHLSCDENSLKCVFIKKF